MHAARRRLRRGLRAALQAFVLALMAALALVVVLGVVFRKAGAALVWYDEVASVLLAWLTFLGSALAALHRAHIGFPKVLDGAPSRARRPLILLGEAIVLAFLVVVAWAGWRVFGVLGGETLVSLPWVPQRLVQSVVPIGAVLYMAAELLTLPDRLREPGSGPSAGDPGKGALDPTPEEAP